MSCYTEIATALGFRCGWPQKMAADHVQGCLRGVQTDAVAFAGEAESFFLLVLLVS